MGSLADRYIIREVAAPFLLGVGAFVVILIGDILYTLAEFLAARRIALGAVLSLLVYKLPAILVITFPVSTLIGVLLGLGRLAKDNEIRAMRLAGMSPARIFLSVVLSGSVIVLSQGGTILSAAEMVFVLAVQIVRAQGTVRLQRGRSTLAGEAFVADMKTGEVEVTGHAVLDRPARQGTGGGGSTPPPVADQALTMTADRLRVRWEAGEAEAEGAVTVTLPEGTARAQKLVYSEPRDLLELTGSVVIRALGEAGGMCGVGSVADVADGIVYAADHGAKVINLSLGGSVGSTVLEDAVNYAYARGVTLVAAAGNDNGPVAYPAAYDNVIAVAATACTNARASYSNFGPQVDVAAPGGDPGVTCGGDSSTGYVWSTSWAPSFGDILLGAARTSAAAPHVAGLAALMISRGITTPATIQATLQSTATDLGASGRDDLYGYGLVNAAAAVGGGSAASRLRAFPGDLVGSTLTIRSDVVEVAASGSFLVTNAHAGTRSVFAWQDFNGDGVLNTGDYFGQTNGVVITDNATTSGVAVTVRNYSGTPITPQSVLTIKRSR